MLTTIVLVTAVLVGLIASVILWAFFLRLGLWWAKVPDVTMRRVVLATAVIILARLGIAVFFLFPPSSNRQVTFLTLLEFTAGALVSCFIIQRVFNARFLRALQAWLPTLLSSVVMMTLAFLVLRPFLFEAFTSPTNGMAPTFLGNHWQGVCPECGRPSYCSPVDIRHAPLDERPMICDNFHVAEVPNVDQSVLPADRFLAAKFLTPRRWDLVVFRFPGDPSVNFVMRIVGLPGETIHIEDGAVWADGKKLTPPDSIRGIEYLSQMPYTRMALWGTVERPAILGDDEYFVLGDFSARSKDSRLWQEGAPGHNPYAVPESYLLGVITHIYWPPERLRIFR